MLSNFFAADFLFDFITAAFVQLKHSSYNGARPFSRTVADNLTHIPKIEGSNLAGKNLPFFMN